jgi:hypothetical protein
MKLLKQVFGYLFSLFLRVWEIAGKILPGDESQRKMRKLLTISGSIMASLLAVIIIFWLFVFAVPYTQELFIKPVQREVNNNGAKSEILRKAIESSNKELQTLRRKYESLTPKQPFLVINTSDNHFFLYRDRKLVREGFVSTGSNIRLQSHDNREWLFKTPKGKHTVKGKITNPVWRRPDWAFIEEGLAVPSATHSSRYQYGVLGDYALNLGDGYLIHGTLYKRFLGMPVTHGCIRMNDEDLEATFKTLNVGSRVYIY